jgi:hypothetical protein
MMECFLVLEAHSHGANSMTTAPAHNSARKLTPEQAADVQSELEALLQSEQFLGSKRCCEFLEFVVKGALSGDYESLTERVLGAELFGRPIDYETAGDAIVRVRANDVRRRLAQHYAEQRLGSSIRISLPPGSYIPEFHWPVTEAAAAPADAADAELSLASVVAGRRGTMWQRLTKPLLVAAVFLLAVNTFLILFRPDPRPPGKVLREFWQPLIGDHDAVIVCFGNATSFWPSEPVRQAIEKGDQSLLNNPGRITMTRDDTVTGGNLRAAVSISNLLSGYGITDELRWPQEVQSVDLSRSNVIFIGGLNNPWSISLNENLRFSFKEIHTVSQSIWMIQDRVSPNQNWSISKAYPESSNVDYALITRVIDRDRKRVVISVGGLGQFGTEAAGEFLTDEAALSSFARTAPHGWENRNLQIVLGMGIDGRKIVNPRILATNAW